MAGMQFQYDEEGGTFYYFLLSFWALILIPATYFLWPSKRNYEADDKKRKCRCPACLIKAQDLNKEKTTVKPAVITFILVVGWIVFVLLAYKVSRIQLDYVEYDPFAELGIDRGASVKDIRQAYRQLSLVYHPDKDTGDSRKFMRIAKAYAALTDEESRKNWEEYGNPDGPEATRFGIALPKWIVERENSMWVLAAYILVFMVILPIVVGIWWYRSIKFSGDQVLLDTSRLYFYFITKTPNMILKRAIMILGVSCEFDRSHNAEIVERPTDNEELPPLIKKLQNVQEKNKERPLCLPYSVKARTLLLAHFQRVPLDSKTLELDQKYILKKCPYLIKDMINTCSAIIALALSRGAVQQPRLETVDNIMKLSQMVVQAVDERCSPLQQLPHISADMLRHFTTRKRDIRHIRDLVSMTSDDRRSLLRGLSDSEYLDVIAVCAKLPYVEMTVKTEVLDEEDTTITAGSIVTVTVNLLRKDMGELFEKEILLPPVGEEPADPIESRGEEEEDGQELGDQAENPDRMADLANQADHKNKSWDKNKKGKKKGGKVKKKVKQVYQWKAAAQAKVEATTTTTTTPTITTKSNSESESPPTSRTEAEKKEKPHDEAGEEASEEDNNEAGSEPEEEEHPEEEDKQKPKKVVPEEEDADDWDNYKMESKKENSLDTKLKESHPVHCPFFPVDKQEGWWIYVANRKQHSLVTAPTFICSLKTQEETQLKFTAPAEPGHYQYTVVLRSDSYYLDFDQMHTIKLDVKEAKLVEDHPQWNISEDEADKDKDDEDRSEDDDDSDYSSDEEGSN